MGGRILIAATESGAGKTTITAGLLAALRRRGRSVQAFKVGPDFIDPSYHEVATGRPAINLDGFLHGRGVVRWLLSEGTSRADVSVIEGVMGLFDGRADGSLSASTAEIAVWTRTPVVLVVDVHGMGNSAAALVLGFTRFLPRLRIAGVVFNRVGSFRHYRLLADALWRANLPPALGYLPRLPEIRRPERYLGLVPSQEQPDMRTYLEVLAQHIEETVDVERLLAIADAAPEPPAGRDPLARLAPLSSVTVAYAYDQAFHFYYHAGLDTLTRLGACLVPFSPLHDSALPADAAVLWLGGGFPELYADQLAANHSLLADLRRFDGPIYAECGGMMYLCRSLRTSDGRVFPLVGRLPADVAMEPRLEALGYVQAWTEVESPLGPPGTQLRAHEFHWSRLTGEPGRALRFRRGEATGHQGFADPRLFASYLHLDFTAQPRAARHLLLAGGARPV